MGYKQGISSISYWQSLSGSSQVHHRQRDMFLDSIMACLPITQGSQGSEARVYRGGSSSSILLATKPPGTSAGGPSLSIPSRRRAILSFLSQTKGRGVKVSSRSARLVFFDNIKMCLCLRYLFIFKSFATAPSKYFFNSDTEN